MIDFAVEVGTQLNPCASFAAISQLINREEVALKLTVEVAKVRVCAVVVLTLKPALICSIELVARAWNAHGVVVADV